MSTGYKIKTYADRKVATNAYISVNIIRKARAFLLVATKAGAISTTWRQKFHSLWRTSIYK
ncbi:MAG: hypothetical protein GZ091_18745 [Paludibacter sp.]|nr:hypothetical protein [Paludibacter sp.]